MKNCLVCLKPIIADDEVEILLDTCSKYIMGKYRWFPCSYCFDCLETCKTTIWKLYMSQLENIDSSRLCDNIKYGILKRPIPIWLTATLTIYGPNIKSLYYKGKMYSSKLYNGMNDFEFYNFQNKIQKNITRYEEENSLYKILSNNLHL